MPESNSDGATDTVDQVFIKVLATNLNCPKLANARYKLFGEPMGKRKILRKTLILSWKKGDEFHVTLNFNYQTSKSQLTSMTYTP